MSVFHTTFYVRCKRDPAFLNTYKMTVRYVLDKDRKPFYARCNACDYYNGSAECHECVAKVNAYLDSGKHNPHFTETLDL